MYRNSGSGWALSAGGVTAVAAPRLLATLRLTSVEVCPALANSVSLSSNVLVSRDNLCYGLETGGLAAASMP
jgi:hypothetical protein